MCPTILAASRQLILAPFRAHTIVSRENIDLSIRHQDCHCPCMFQPSVSLPEISPDYSTNALNQQRTRSFGRPNTNVWLDNIRRRWQRERRRRKVGRAYDMALEIARVLPANSRLLDVGCGNGFISHHLSGMLRADVIGIDLEPGTEAVIDYRQFGGKHFPVADQSVDAVLLCYVLHHAQDLAIVLSELRRVLSAAGQAIIYEDIPLSWWDRAVCWIHNLKWRKRTGPCTFRQEAEWSALFNSAGFEITNERLLSRCRNLAHPVRRGFYVIRKK